MWTLGYIIGQIPSNLILTRVRPSIWIPSLELTWTILTFSLAHCNTAKQIYAVRFLVGLAESGFYPGMQYVIGSWYTKEELAKRSCIFHTSSAVASVFSGYLMAAVYHLEGVGGFRGWQCKLSPRLALTPHRLMSHTQQGSSLSTASSPSPSPSPATSYSPTTPKTAAPST